MKIVIARHAEREHLQPETEDRLSERGCAQAIELARRLNEKALNVRGIWCAPTRAARETAARAIPGMSPRDMNLLLGPGPDHIDPAEVLSKLAICTGENDAILMVGHEPKSAAFWKR